jgi:hypothetical protein
MARAGFRLPLFFVLSTALHVAGWGALTHRSARSPATTFDTTAQTIAGDTLDVEPQAPAEEVPVESEGEQVPPTPEPGQAPKPAERVPGLGAAPPPAAARNAGAAERAPSNAEGASQAAAQPALFGAVGVRFATDLPTTFTSLFPSAASADPAWSQAAFGSAGVAEVTLVIDESGHIVSENVAGAPSQALRQGIDRTLAALRARTFTARAAMTKLRVTAHIQRDEVHDGLHGDVFALSGRSFMGDVGTAFFALPGPGGGRRVDVELKLLR